MMVNGTMVKHWSRTEATRALSTAGAEYYACAEHGGAEHGGSLETKLEIERDASSAMAFSTRCGLGKAQRGILVRDAFFRDAQRSRAHPVHGVRDKPGDRVRCVERDRHLDSPLSSYSRVNRPINCIVFILTTYAPVGA